MRQQPTSRVIRKAIGAGRWFPGRRNELHAMVRGYIEQAQVPAIKGNIVAAIAPHAGFVYSGPVAGYTFKALSAQPDPQTVVVLGFSHRGSFQGVAFMDGDWIETPLGLAPLDQSALQILTQASERLYVDYRPHVGEHSAENEVPFVQVAMPQSKLVIGLMGDHDRGSIDDLVEALDRLAEDRSIVIVASTDMLHDPDYDRVTETDRATLQHLARMDIPAIQSAWGYSNQVFCGLSPVMTAIHFAKRRHCENAEILHYRNSGDDHPSSRGTWVVGYGSAVFVAR